MTNETEQALIKRLGICASMIEMGDRIRFGSETTLMREAMTALKAQAEKDRVMDFMAEALEECKTAIDWYRSEHPEDYSNADSEFDERFNNAIAEHAKLKEGK